jgi:hypothetical protein
MNCNSNGLPIGPRPHGVTRDIAKKYVDANTAPVGEICDKCGTRRSADRKLYMCRRCQRKYYVCPCVDRVFPASHHARVPTVILLRFMLSARRSARRRTGRPGGTRLRAENPRTSAKVVHQG